jgi:hypothetical protein
MLAGILNHELTPYLPSILSIVSSTGRSRLGGGRELIVTLRLAFLTAPLLLLLMMPWGEAGVMLALFVAVDLGAAALMLRPEQPRGFRVVQLRGDTANMELTRRIAPELRMRRPALAIDAQIHWRQMAEAHRRRRELNFALRRD